MLGDLPDELLSLVLSDVPFKQRCGLSLVCTRWWRLLQQPGIHWRDMVVASRRTPQLAWLLAGGRASLTEELIVHTESNPEGTELLSVDWIPVACPRLQHLRFDDDCTSLNFTTATLDGFSHDLPGLRTLHVGDTRRAALQPSLASELSRLTNLRDLRIRNDCANMPAWLPQLQQLRSVELFVGGPTPGMALTEAVAGLNQLTRLSLYLCDEAALVLWGEDPLPGPLQEVVLHLSGEEDEPWVQAMWAAFARLPRLRGLQLHTYAVPIQSTLSCLGRLSTLRQLRLYGRDILSLPEEIEALQHLTELRLQGCTCLAEFPWGSMARGMGRLQALDLRHTCFRGPEMGDFQLLARLPDLRLIRWWTYPTVVVAPEEYSAAVEAAEQFDLEYGTHLDAGGVHEAVLRQPGGSPLIHAQQ